MGLNAIGVAQAGLIGLIGQIGGGVMSAAGSFFGAGAQKSALNAQAGLADTNARIAELGAQSTLTAGQKEVGRMTLKAGQVKSSQRASMAANGIDLGVGNAAEVLATTDLVKEIDKNQLEANTAASAYGMRTQAVNFQNEAITKRATAGGISPFAATATSLIGSATRVATGWYSMQRAFGSPSAAASGAVPGYSSDTLGNGIRF